MKKVINVNYDEINLAGLMLDLGKITKEEYDRIFQKEIYEKFGLKRGEYEVDKYGNVIIEISS